MINFLEDMHALPALHVFTISINCLPLQTLSYRYAYGTSNIPLVHYRIVKTLAVKSLANKDYGKFGRKRFGELKSILHRECYVNSENWQKRSNLL